MSSFFRGLAYGVAHAFASNLSRSRRRMPFVPGWVLPPLVRLGMCGIQSLRHDFAVEAVRAILREMRDEQAGRPLYLTPHVEVPSTSSSASVVAFLGDHVLLVQCQVKDPVLQPADLVARADRVASAVAEMTGSGAQLTTVVCLHDSSEEPRELPAPSGRAVTLTGRPWLAGIARRALLPGQRVVDESAGGGGGARWISSALRTEMARASRVAADVYPTYRSLLPDPNWWVIPRLHLDDGTGEPIELAVVGPTGAFVLQPDRHGVAEARDRAIRGAHRLHPYLPAVTCVPIVVDRDAQQQGGVMPDPAGRPQCWALPPDSVADAVKRSPTWGADPETIMRLNAPMFGWSRVVGGETGDHTWLRWRL